MVVLAGGRLDIAVAVPWLAVGVAFVGGVALAMLAAAYPGTAGQRRLDRARRRLRVGSDAPPPAVPSRVEDARLARRSPAFGRRPPRSLDDDRHPATRPQRPPRSAVSPSPISSSRSASPNACRPACRHAILISRRDPVVTLCTQVVYPDHAGAVHRPDVRRPRRRRGPRDATRRGGSPALSRDRRHRPRSLRAARVGGHDPRRTDRRVPDRLRRGRRRRRPAGRARLGPASRRVARDDGHRHRDHLRDRRALAQGRDRACRGRPRSPRA